MRCSKAQFLISTAMDGEISAPESVALASHLDSCARCRQYQEDLLACRSLLQKSELAPSAQFEWKVQLGIRKALRREAAKDSTVPGRFWKPLGISAAVSAAVVVLVGLWLLPIGAGRVSVPGSANGGWASPVSTTVATTTLSHPAVRPAAVRMNRSNGYSATPVLPVASTLPVWNSGIRPDWRTPPSLRGQVSVVSDLRMGFPETLDLHPRFGYRAYGLPRGAASRADSLVHRASLRR